MTAASILIPTHDHAVTLPYTVRSVLAQTEASLEVLIVGDGATDAVRSVAEDLAATDPRVRFLDFPKGPHHGEIHRGAAILQSEGDAIFYLCDDDLLMPTHAEDLLALLAENDFVQSRNGHIEEDGRIRLYPGDLGRARDVERLVDPDRVENFVSITGTAHTRAFYDRVDRPWETTPATAFPDHHQWRRMLGAGPARTATSHRMTALQFPSHADGRAEWADARREAEIAEWAARIARPGAQAEIDALLQESVWRALDLARDDLRDARDAIQWVRSTRWWRLREAAGRLIRR